MTTQPALSFDHGLPFEILDSQPDPAKALERLDQAHAICEHFGVANDQSIQQLSQMLKRIDRNLRADDIENLLAEDKRLFLASDMEEKS